MGALKIFRREKTFFNFTLNHYIFNMESKKKSIIKATKGGRLYIKNEDFFKQDKVKEIIRQLKGSSIYQNIENIKKEITTV